MISVESKRIEWRDFINAKCSGSSRDDRRIREHHEIDIKTAYRLVHGEILHCINLAPRDSAPRKPA